MVQIVAFTSVISFLITYYIVPFFCCLAYKFNILDIPNTTIKRHKKPTPYLGGVAVYIGFAVASAITFSFDNQIVLLFIGATLLLLIGLVDDLIVIKPYQKFFGQCIAAFCFLKAIVHIKEQFFLNSIIILTLPVSLLWILTIINAFNLIDVMDGLATTTALMISCSLFFIAYSTHNTQACLLLAAFIGALLGFFLHNKPFARIYLGDSGSLFIGGFLAVIPFLISWCEHTRYGIITPCIIFTVPLLEIGMLILIRTYKGIPFYQGSPDHFAHYLQKKGWAPSKILILTGLFSFILSALSALFFFNVLGLIPFSIIAILLVLFWIILVYKP